MDHAPPSFLRFRENKTFDCFAPHNIWIKEKIFIFIFIAYDFSKNYGRLSLESIDSLKMVLKKVVSKMDTLTIFFTITRGQKIFPMTILIKIDYKQPMG